MGFGPFGFRKKKITYKSQVLLERRSELSEEEVREEAVVAFEVLPERATPFLLGRDAGSVDVVGIGLRSGARLGGLMRKVAFQKGSGLKLFDG